MKEKNIIFTARIMSMIFTPFYLPIVGLIALFIFSYMSLLPMMYKLVMLAMVYLLTVVAPSLLIHLYRLCQGWTSHELGRKERRLVPYIISIVCYFACFFWMEYRNTPRVISIIVVVALTIQMVCALINIWWKDQHPYSRHRRRGRRTGILFHRLLFQPAVVALLRADTGRSRRNGAHDTATALTLAGGRGIPRRSRLRHPGHLKPAPS